MRKLFAYSLAFSWIRDDTVWKKRKFLNHAGNTLHGRETSYLYAWTRSWDTTSIKHLVNTASSKRSTRSPRGIYTRVVCSTRENSSNIPPWSTRCIARLLLSIPPQWANFLSSHLARFSSPSLSRCHTRRHIRRSTTIGIVWNRSEARYGKRSVIDPRTHGWVNTRWKWHRAGRRTPKAYRRLEYRSAARVQLWAFVQDLTALRLSRLPTFPKEIENTTGSLAAFAPVQISIRDRSQTRKRILKSAVCSPRRANDRDVAR